VHGWRVRGPLDVPTLEAALADVVERHETLRTEIVRDAAGLHQRVHAAAPPELLRHDLSGVHPDDRDRRAEELLVEVESGALGIDQVPHLRAVLGRFDEADWLLVLVTHHSATDGWSVRVTIRDLAECYAARREGRAPRLPAKEPYAAFASWQRSVDVESSSRYWRDTLQGAQVFVLPTDFPRSAGREPVTAVYRFHLPAEVVGPALKLARTTRSSPFMVLLAALYVLIARRTGRTDLTMPTFTPGRPPGRFEDTVGSFFNFMPLRVDLTGCGTFREVLASTRATCLDAYSHDIPTMHIFAQAPALMQPAMADGAAPVVFQAFPFPYVLDGTAVGDLEYTELRRRLVSQPVGSDVPDGGLWTFNIDPVGDVVGSMQYRSNLFTESTVARLVDDYHAVLRAVVADPDVPLGLAAVPRPS
jgi:condensation enzyme